MFKRIVTLVRGLMGCQSTDRSLSMVEQPSPNAKPLPVKSTQQSRKAVRKPRQSAQQPSSKKQKAVSQTSAVKEGQSKKRKPVATAKQPSTRGKSTRTPALLTPQAVKPAPDLFLNAANQLGIPPDECVVFEDAAVGITAAKAANMWVVGLGPEERVGDADVVLPSLAGVKWDELIKNLFHAEAQRRRE